MNWKNWFCSPTLYRSPIHRARRRAHPVLTRLQDRTVPTSFRTIDGTNNNADHPTWGSAGIQLLRKAMASYADNIDDPVVGSPARPSARAISNAVVDEGGDRQINYRFMSAMIYA